MAAAFYGGLKLAELLKSLEVHVIDEVTFEHKDEWVHVRISTTELDPEHSRFNAGNSKSLSFSLLEDGGQVLEKERFWKQVKTARDKLYEDLPTGDIDSFALLKVIKTHIAKLDEILEDS